MARFTFGKDTGELARYFASLEGVVLAYLFGSQARKRSRADSDVDVAALLTGCPSSSHCLETRLEIVGGLMGLLQTNEVDVVILNQAPPALRYAVLRDGVLLFCRDRRAAMEFRLRTIDDYLDFLPILRRHERAFLAKVRKGELCSGPDADPRPPQPDPEVLARSARLPDDAL